MTQSTPPTPPTLSDLEARHREVSRQIAAASHELALTVPFTLAETGWQFTRNGRILEARANRLGTCYTLFDASQADTEPRKIASRLRCTIYDLHVKIALGEFDHIA